MAVPFFLFDKEENALLGGLTIGLIRRGAAQSCMIGYWMGERHSRQGHMFAALSTGYSLHLRPTRVAPYRGSLYSGQRQQPDGYSKKTGFEREGLLRDYLKINGEWRDHLLYSRIGAPKARNGKTILMTHTANRLRAVPRLAALCMAAFAALYVGLAASAALAVEPVKIARDDNALDLTATTEIYTNQGEAFQVSTAAGADGIRPTHRGARRPPRDIRATGPSLRSPTSRKSSSSGVIVAPHFRLVGLAAVLAGSGLAAHHGDHAIGRLCARPRSRARMPTCSASR